MHHAFRSGDQKVVLHGIAERFDSQRIAHDHQIARGVDEGDVERAIPDFRQRGKHGGEMRAVISAHLAVDVVHHHLGIRMVGDVIAGGCQVVFEMIVIGQVAIEGDGEPFPHPSVDALERLGVGAVGGAAGGVAVVPDGGNAGILLHQAPALVGGVQPEYLVNRPQILMGLQDAVPSRIVGSDARAELPPVLQFQQSAYDEGIHIAGIFPLTGVAAHLIRRDNSAFLFQPRHK